MELILILLSFLIVLWISLIVKQRGIIEFSSVVVSTIACTGSIAVALKVASSGVYAPFQFFYIDALGAIVMLIIAFVGLATTIYSVQYLREETAKNIIGLTKVRQYFILLNLFLAVMFLAVTTSSPIFAWISIEATTLSTSFLISFYNKPSAIEAAWKYLIINSVGLLLGFFGTLLYFSSAPTSVGNGFIDWMTLTANAVHLDPSVAKIAFIFALIGYGTKVGLAPMHTWLPDAHSKAPAPISALLSGVLLNVTFIIVLRFKVMTDAAVGQYFSQELLIAFGVISILVAALFIVVQKKYKRLLAYSSIENMGIIALGFGFGGLGVFAAIIHMIYHALIKSALFLSAGTIFLRYSSTNIARVKGAFTALSVTSIIFLTGFFAITGTPPLGIFFTKVFILSAGIKTHFVVTAAVLLLMSILFIGFFKHVSDMVLGEKPTNIIKGEGNVWLIIPPLVLIAVAFYLSFYIPPFLYVLLNDVISHY